MGWKPDAMRQYLIATDNALAAWNELTSSGAHIPGVYLWSLLKGVWLADCDLKTVTTSEAREFLKGFVASDRAGEYVRQAINGGFLVKEQVESDRRRFRIRLSEKTRQRFENVVAAAMDELEPVFRRLATEE